MDSKKQFQSILEHDNGDKEIYFFSSIASTPDEAMEKYNLSRFSDNWIKPKMISCSYRHGGFRDGAGKKKDYAESTKAHKIPLTMAQNFKQFLISIADLIDILDEYEEIAKNSPTSPRFDKLNKVLEQTKDARNLIRKVVNAFRGL